MTQDLIDWKTRAWTDPGKVALYTSQVTANRGTNTLKNNIEIGLVDRYVIGSQVLDVGIGTGRGSLQLIDKGCSVTGIDSSQAMLDACRKLAGDRPITLQQADLANLPFPDGNFDTLIALNVLVHFPHWRDVLPEWARTVKHGGRLVFDAYSLDHVERVAGKHLVPIDKLLAPERSQPSKFFLRITMEELVEVCNQHGLRIVAAHPYAVVLGGASRYFWFDGTRASGAHWNRLLSWVAADEHFYRFAEFIEKTFLWLCPSAATHLMVVLDRVPDPGGNAAWLAKQEEMEMVLASGIGAESLRLVLGSEFDAWRQQLNSHLTYPLNRHLLFTLYSAVLDQGVNIDLRSLVAEEYATQLVDWRTREETDRKAYGFVCAWHTAPLFADVLSVSGVPLGPPLEYEAMRTTLRTVFQYLLSRPL